MFLRFNWVSTRLWHLYGVCRFLRCVVLIKNVNQHASTRTSWWDLYPKDLLEKNEKKIAEFNKKMGNIMESVRHSTGNNYGVPTNMSHPNQIRQHSSNHGLLKSHVAGGENRSNQHRKSRIWRGLHYLKTETGTDQNSGQSEEPNFLRHKSRKWCDQACPQADSLWNSIEILQHGAIPTRYSTGAPPMGSEKSKPVLVFYLKNDWDSLQASPLWTSIIILRN